MPQFNGKQGASFRACRQATCHRCRPTCAAPATVSGWVPRGAPLHPRQPLAAHDNGAPGRLMESTRQPGYRPTRWLRSRSRVRPFAGGEAGPGTVVSVSFHMTSLKLIPRAGIPFALAVLAPVSFAQVALPEVVVSASRTEQRMQDALPATTVLTRADI